MTARGVLLRNSFQSTDDADAVLQQQQALQQTQRVLGKIQKSDEDADEFVTTSDFSGQDLAEHIRHLPDNVQVIGQGPVTLRFAPSAGRQLAPWQIVAGCIVGLCLVGVICL